MKFLMITILLIFIGTAIPSLVWRDVTPNWVKAVAMGSILVGGIITLRERFRMWNELSAMRRALRQVSPDSGE